MRHLASRTNSDPKIFKRHGGKESSRLAVQFSHFSLLFVVVMQQQIIKEEDAQVLPGTIPELEALASPRLASSLRFELGRFPRCGRSELIYGSLRFLLFVSIIPPQYPSHIQPRETPMWHQCIWWLSHRHILPVSIQASALVLQLNTLPVNKQVRQQQRVQNLLYQRNQQLQVE